MYPGIEISQKKIAQVLQPKILLTASFVLHLALYGDKDGPDP